METPSPPPMPPVQITIITDVTTGAMQINGLPPNKIMALGILALATHLVETMGEKKESEEPKSPIMIPPPGLTGLRRM